MAEHERITAMSAMLLHRDDGFDAINFLVKRLTEAMLWTIG